MNTSKQVSVTGRGISLAAWKTSATTTALTLMMSVLLVSLSGFNFALASITNGSATVDGASSGSFVSSESISATVTVTTSGSDTADDWKSTSWRIGDGSFACVNTSNHTQDGTYSETFNVTAPSETGTYAAEFVAYNGESCSGGFSSTISLPDSVTVVQPFADTFGVSESSTISGWTDSGSETEGDSGGEDTARNGNPANKFAKIGETGGGSDGYMCRTITATGYYDLALSYGWNGDDDTESDDQGIVEYKSIGSCSDGSGWTSLASHDLNDETWNSVSGTDLSALDNSSFLLRFRRDASASDEYFRVDDVIVSGNTTPPTGTLIINKRLINNNGGNNATTSFSFQVNGGDATVFEEDGSNVVTVPAGDYSVVEVGDPLADYITSYTDCSGTIANGETKTCTIENDDRTATLHIIKNVVGGDGTFNFVVTQGETLVASPSIDTAEDGNDSVDMTINANTDYIVEEPSVPEGWDFTSVSCDAGVAGPSATSYTVNVDSGVIVNCTYTNTKRASFSLAKLSAPEDSAFQFKFDLTGPDFTDSETFSPSGTWSEHVFDLVPGDYSIIETIVSGDWTGTQEMACNGDGDNDPSGSVASTFPFTLNPGEEMSCTVNNTEDALISGKKFEDMDADGLAGEDSGLSDWTIMATQVVADDPETPEVDESADPLTYTRETDDDGNYSFRLPPGEYKICEITQESWIQSYPVSGGAEVVACEENYGYSVTVAAGGNVSGMDFGNYQNGSITGYKWNDVNGDGIWDIDEAALSGWTIELAADADPETVIGTQETHEIPNGVDVGQYLFDDLKPGTYRLSENMGDRTGWVQTYPSDPAYYTVTVHSGEEISEYANFGNAEGASIIGSKWNDENGDAEWQRGCESECTTESGLEGWTITATPIDGEGGDAIGDSLTTTTASDGSYSFDFLPAQFGWWRITEVAQSGWEQTVPEGETFEINVSGGTTYEANDFGNHRDATISGVKWNDEDGDSTRDEGDSGLSGWVITATPVGSDGLPMTEEGRSATSTTTGESGSYSLSFDLSNDGFWKITETTQSGWTKTFPAEGSSYLVEVTATSTSIADKDFGNHREQTSDDSEQQEEEIVRPSGGNGPIVGSLAQGQVLGASIGPSGQVLGTSTTTITTTNETTCSESVLTQYMRRGKKNDPEQVKMLQQFLNDEMNSNLPLTGFFGRLTENAVKAFQQKYASDILTPWGLTEPTGYVYKFTLWKINSLICATLNAPKPEV